MNIPLDQQIKAVRLQLRYWAKVDRGNENECWNWLAYVKPDGYGQFGVGRKLIPAHRVAYISEKGPIPLGLQIDHLCRNRACVNPAHLEAVTSRTNILRGEGVSANYAKRQHCVNGHPLNGDNIRLKTDGSRLCKQCDRAYQRSLYAKTHERKRPSKYDPAK